MPCGAVGSPAPESPEVPEMAEPSKTEQRKAEHVNIILQENVSAEYNYWNDVKLVHRALPEIDLDDVDVGVKFLGKKLEAPLIISSMTGGFGMGKEINANLAKGAAEVGVAMGVGSQRAALEKPDLAPTYAVVKDYRVPFPAHGEGDRRRDLTGDRPAAESRRRQGDRRRWARRHFVLGG